MSVCPECGSELIPEDMDAGEEADYCVVCGWERL